MNAALAPVTPVAATAVIMAVAYGFYNIYHRFVSGKGHQDSHNLAIMSVDAESGEVSMVCNVFVCFALCNSVVCGFP